MLQRIACSSAQPKIDSLIAESASHVGNNERAVHVESEALEVLRCATTLRDAPLLRATPVSEVLRLGGMILGGSAGSVETYRLSHVTKAIDTFISHNWSTGREVKFVTLSLHFEYRWAAGVSAGMASMLIFLSFSSWIPFKVAENCCKVLGVPVFLLVG